MINTYFDICALTILLILLVSMIVRRQVFGRTNYIMFWIILFSVAATFGDLAGAMIANYATYSKAMFVWDYVFNYLYFLAHNMIMPMFVIYIYSSIDIWHVYSRKKYLIVIWSFLAGSDIVCLALNKIVLDVFSISDDLKYSRGPWISVFYAVAAAFGVWCVCTLIAYRKIINSDKRRVLYFNMIVLCAGILIQLFVPGMAVEMFSIAISVLFYCVVVKREENQLDPITGAIKYNEGIERVSKNFISEKPISVSLTKIVNHRNILMYMGQEHYNSFLHLLTDSFRRIAKDNEWRPDIYYLENGLYALVGEGREIEKAKKTANEINAFLKNELEISDYRVMMSSVHCVARYPEDVSDFATLMTLGTTFHRTMRGKEEVIIYADYRDDREYRLRNDIEEIIARGLANNSFEMYYQPIYSTVKHRFTCAEALLRLKDEEYGFVSPGVFLPVAELNGSIHDIGDFVTRDVIKFLKENSIKDLGLEYIEMNLSASQCIEVDLVDKILSLLEENKVPTGQLRLEITETAADINPEIVDVNVRRLHEYGIHFSLDDYGTGYSNIKRVTALPIDQVKLDKNFVDMIDDPMMWVVIQDTIKMLKEMGKEIIVEGVEKEYVAKKFMDLRADLLQGCELIQGFYFCKPLPKDEFVKFMKDHK